MLGYSLYEILSIELSYWGASRERLGVNCLGDNFHGRRILLLSMAVIAVVVITMILIIQALSTSPVEVSSAGVTYQDPMTAYATFTNIGNYHVGANCSNLNIANQCALQVSQSLVNNKFYTKSIILKLTSAESSTLAVGVNTYTSPPQRYTVGYGSDALNTRLVTIAPSVVSPGGTWTFTVYVVSPPAMNGKPDLRLGVGQAVENHFLCKTFDIQSSFALPNSSL